MRESTAAKRDTPPLNGDLNVAFRVKCTKLGHGHRVSISCHHPPFIPSEYDGRSYEDNKVLSRTAARVVVREHVCQTEVPSPPHEISNQDLRSIFSDVYHNVHEERLRLSE